MRTTDLDYVLPKELIAQSPARPRDHSRLMVLQRNSGKVEHHRFNEIGRYLNSGDVLVINDTKVVPARLLMQRQTGGRVELLLIKRVDNNTWEVMVNSNRRLKTGEVLSLVRGGSPLNPGNHTLTARMVERCSGNWLVEFSLPVDDKLLEAVGIAPLPPYIKREYIPEKVRRRDIRDYQTVYARQAGAIAAPTAGLHFTKPLLNQLQKQGVEIAHITLHVGPGTFKPVKTDVLSEHQMDAESFEVLPDALIKIITARQDNRRIIAVGTTVTRVLETISGYISTQLLHPYLVRQNIHRTGVVTGLTDIFIYPPYKFRMIDGLITNFHLPRGTPLALVYALAGRKLVQEAYQAAIRKKYRFYSYGDAMLII